MDKKEIVKRNYDQYVGLEKHFEYDSSEEYSADFAIIARQLKPKSHVLIIGGTHYECDYFLQRGCLVTNIDISKKILNKVKELSPNTITVLSDISGFESDEKYEVVVAIRSLIHLEPDQLENVLKKLNHILTDSGILVTVFFTTDQADFLEEMIPEPTGDSSEKTSYRVLYRSAYLQKLYEIADFKVNRSQHSVDIDGEESVFIVATANQTN